MKNILLTIVLLISFSMTCSCSNKETYSLKKDISKFETMAELTDDEFLLLYKEIYSNMEALDSYSYSEKKYIDNGKKVKLYSTMHVNMSAKNADNAIVYFQIDNEDKTFEYQYSANGIIYQYTNDGKSKYSEFTKYMPYSFSPLKKTTGDAVVSSKKKSLHQLVNNNYLFQWEIEDSNSTYLKRLIIGGENKLLLFYSVAVYENNQLKEYSDMEIKHTADLNEPEWVKDVK